MENPVHPRAILREDGWRCRRRMIWQVSVLPACRRLASSALSHMNLAWTAQGAAWP